MKRKLILLLTLCCVLCFSLAGLTACKEQHTHVYNQRVVSETYLASDATCLQKAKYYFSCECGDVGSVTFENGDYANHNYENGECSICKKADPLINSNDPNQPTHTHIYNQMIVNESYLASNATCKEKAKYYFSCLCGKTDVGTFEYGETEEHTYNDKYSISDTHHWIATTCGCDIKKNYSKHVVGYDGYCTICSTLITTTDGILYDKSTDGNYIEVIGYEGTETKIRIADTYNGLPVKNIYKNAFEKTNITSVIIPNSITTISERAFFNCSALTSVSMSDSVTTIDDYAFAWCDSLENLTIGNGVTHIGEECFWSCDSLTEITLPASILTVENYAFWSCAKLENLTIIGNNQTTIGDRAFSGCSSLTYVTISNNIKSFGKDVFSDCKFYENENVNYIGNETNPCLILVGIANTKFSTYKINENTKYICSGAFDKCERLSTIIIPNNIFYIGSTIFSNCSMLTNIYCQPKNKPNNWSNDWNYGCSATVIWGYDGE